ncbi:hypothetical protein Q8W71_28860 [Methylobacterium sp. NEAU 140]|uniref:hypothetical protein n=1 Tax=Methylobacterium sp. NEAU 140 TaxID=3064945 RepID=UPI00273662B9|nr:hypothetical protein [Methylobacterium sp. NEAU 140]MDP4026624.1 hypothetical protein [Methylobacterium sp. NEAU 140]
MRNQNQQGDRAGQQGSRQPTHDVKLRRPSNEKPIYERIGAGWQREDGTFYVRLHGTQIVSEGFYLYPVGDDR